MKIALVFAAASLRRGVRLKHFMIPPHSLQIISALTPKEHEVVIYDEYHRLTPSTIDADLVGISVWTASTARAYQLADQLRARNIPVILGGPHVSLCPDEARAHADSIIIGEGESIWREVVNDFKNHRLKQQYFGKPIPLSETPDADWNCVSQSDYVLPSSISTSRGCTKKCGFCFESSRQGIGFRQRPLDMVLREIQNLSSNVVAFIDNDLLADRNYAKQLLHALIPMKIHWFGMTTIGAANDESLLDLLVESGCRTLYIGFESINPHCLNEVQKGWNSVDEYIRNIQRIHDRDIMVNGSFVFGFDHDTTDVFSNTVNFGIEAKLETATYTILTPYPGTNLYKSLLKDNRITDHNWEHYDTTRVVYQPKLMSQKELEFGYYQAYRDFYSWSSILKRCRSGEPGFSKRILLNAAYKKIEPLYCILGKYFKAGWTRPVMNWYSKRNK